jgi:hypothetical protein
MHIGPHVVKAGDSVDSREGSDSASLIPKVVILAAVAGEVFTQETELCEFSACVWTLQVRKQQQSDLWWQLY